MNEWMNESTPGLVIYIRCAAGIERTSLKSSAFLYTRYHGNMFTLAT
jgi:hypothetical protein